MDSRVTLLQTVKNALKGSDASRGDRLAIGGNVVNPMVGRRVQHLATSGEEQTVEVVRNHEGGTRLMLAPSARRSRGGNISGSGEDSSDAYGGGVIFDNPKRGA